MAKCFDRSGDDYAACVYEHCTSGSGMVLDKKRSMPPKKETISKRQTDAMHVSYLNIRLSNYYYFLMFYLLKIFIELFCGVY